MASGLKPSAISGTSTLLRISSTLVDCWTGRSDSFSPLRIRPDLATARTMVLACAASTPDQALRQRLEERIAACRRRDRAWRWRRPDCVAGLRGLELRYPCASHVFEMSIIPVGSAKPRHQRLLASE